METSPAQCGVSLKQYGCPTSGRNTNSVVDAVEVLSSFLRQGENGAIMSDAVKMERRIQDEAGIILLQALVGIRTAPVETAEVSAHRLENRLPNGRFVSQRRWTSN